MHIIETNLLSGTFCYMSHLVRASSDATNGRNRSGKKIKERAALQRCRLLHGYDVSWPFGAS